MALVLHATTVAFGGRAVVILGPSGSGKSGLALQLMAMGAGLVADDRTAVTVGGEGPGKGETPCGAAPGPVDSATLPQSAAPRSPPTRAVATAVDRPSSAPIAGTSGSVLPLGAPALIASCPATLSGLIEARGVGILRAAPHPPCPVALVIDLGRTETARLPEPKTITLLDVALPLLHKSDTPHFAAAIRAYILGGCHDDQS